MTVSSSTRKAGPFNGNGATTSFPFTFKVFAASDLQLTHTSTTGVETALVLNTHYTVALNADQDNNPGGTITYPATGTDYLATGEKLTGVGVLSSTQGSDITNAGRFNAQVFEDALDKAAILTQQVEEKVGRALLVPVTEASVGQVPSDTDRAGKYLAFDAAGAPTASAGTGNDAALRTDLAASGGSALVGFLQAGTGAVARTEEEKSRDIVAVKDFGASGGEAEDNADGILKAFNSVRASGGAVYFTNGATYLVSHGFLVPSNTVVYLNGSTLMATTTWGQGTIPTNGSSRAMLAIAGSTALSAVLSSDTENVSVIGDGAVLDMRYDEQTGSPPGAMGIVVETTPAPIVGNLWKTHDILVKDVVITDALWYGTYTEGAKDVTWDNVRAIRSANLGHVVVCGWNVHYEKCHGSYTQERSANQGNGFWNEANETWQLLRNITYGKCRAEYNKKSGFRYYNDGADVEVSIIAEENVSRFNLWNGSAQTGSSAESGHIIYKTGAGTADLLIVLNNCVAEDEYGAGFKINRTATCTGRQRVVLNNPVTLNCMKENIDSYQRSPIHIGGASSDAQVFINNPVIIAPAANTLGYGIGAEYAKNVFVTNPRFHGTFTYKLVTGNLAGVARKSAGWDPGWDDGTGHIGSGTPFYKPVRLASFDQTTEPVAGTDTHTNELCVWQDDTNQFHGIFTRDDSVTPKYVDFMAGKRLRVTGVFTGAAIAANTVQNGTVAVTGAALGDRVHFTIDVAQDVSLVLSAEVSAANTVRWKVANPTAGVLNSTSGNYIINVLPHGV